MTIQVSPNCCSRLLRVGDVQIHCLDWSSEKSDTIIFIHGLGDNPFIFEEPAERLAQRYRVVAYARRGHGRSEQRPPFDSVTLMEDLHDLMNALQIEHAVLVGWSMGGNEITMMAGRHPQRVKGIIYLDAGYDWSDPEFSRIMVDLPQSLRLPPAAALTSLESLEDFYKKEVFTALNDLGPVRRYIQELVTTKMDGSLGFRTEHISDMLLQSLTENAPLRYDAVDCPALAIYPETTLNLEAKEAPWWMDAVRFERSHMQPFRVKSKLRIEAELKHLETESVAGNHLDFFLRPHNRVWDIVTNFVEHLFIET